MVVGNDERTKTKMVLVVHFMSKHWEKKVCDKDNFLGD